MKPFKSETDPGKRSGFLFVAISGMIIAGALAIYTVTLGKPDFNVEKLGDIAPFNQLNGVALMAAEDLKKVRPALKSAPYWGYVDTVAGYRVGYRFPGLYDDQTIPSSGSRVQEVLAVRSFQSDSAALTIVRSDINALTARLGSGECTEWKIGDRRIPVAHWRLRFADVSVTPLKTLMENQWNPGVQVRLSRSTPIDRLFDYLTRMGWTTQRAETRIPCAQLLKNNLRTIREVAE